jgi:hypothetical protein
MADDPILELYKLEYDKCATRYENIYQAVWRIFSHLALVSGAILSFGGDRLVSPLFWFLVTFPLVFWFWSTYFPLDRYGNNTLTRLKAIEETLNAKYSTSLDQYGDFVRRREGIQLRRTQTWVWITFAPVTAICLYNFVLTLCLAVASEPLLLQKRPQEVRISLDAKNLEQVIKVTVVPMESSPSPAKGTPGTPATK